MTATVVSNKMDKTLVVEVVRTAVHPKYQKRYKVRKKYSVSCDNSKNFAIGQVVEIESCRPISKTVKFKVVQSPTSIQI
jgi:small subunit ribosomal protein S17